MSPGAPDRPGARERDRFFRRRARAATEAGLLVAGLAVMATLLLAPGYPGEIRLGGVSLAWWVAMASIVAGALALVGRRAAVVSPRVGPGLAAAGTWLSAALAVEMVARIVGDGTLGPWLPVVVAAAAWMAVGVTGSGAPDGAGGQAGVPAAVAVRRWRLGGGWSLGLLVLADGLVSMLWLWAQLAVVRELGLGAGWSAAAGPAALGLAVMVALLLKRVGSVVGPLAATAGLGALAVGLAAVMAASSPGWPRVWAEVADRSGFTFPPGSPWTEVGSPLSLQVADEGFVLADDQRVVLAGRGAARLQPWEGGDVRRDVDGQLALMVRRGDRLSVPPGVTAQFEPGRRVPGAPATGADWVHPPGRPRRSLDVIGLALTVVAGLVGLAPALSALGDVRAGQGRLGRLAAGGGVAVGCLAIMLWSLYAVWLGPEVYLAGGAGPAVLDELARAASLGPSAPAIRLAALGGVAALGLAASLAAARAFAGAAGLVTGDGRLPALGVVVLAAGLAAVVPVVPWSLAVAALTLAAATGAPALLLARWSIRTTGRGVAAGVAAGLVASVFLAGLGLTEPVATRGAESWAAWLAHWPALVGLPLALVVSWLLRARRGAVDRGALPPGLGDLHG